MFSENQSKARISKVSIDIKANRYRIRFTYPKGRSHELRIAQVSDEGWLTALRAAKLINQDIDLGIFDDTYAKYSPTHAKRLELAAVEAQKEIVRSYNIIELWERYKELNQDRIAATSQAYWWKDVDRYLSQTPKDLISLDKAQEFLQYLQTRYAASTINTLFRSFLHPAINSGIQGELVESNPFYKLTFPKQVKKPIQCYEPEEIKLILDAFAKNIYNPKCSRYKHSYYYTYVSFLSLVGCRPEEALALVKEDIRVKGNRTYIRFNKSYSKGILLPHTKTHEIRLFPVNEQLKALLSIILKEQNLLFPGVKGSYINHHRWRESNWRRVVNGLVDDGLIESYFKPYSLRHSFITRLVREGVDIATIGRISGNSPETIIKHYLAAKDSFDIPEL